MRALPKKAYPSEAVLVTTRVALAGRADRSKLEAAALSSDGLYPSDADRSADADDRTLRTRPRPPRIEKASKLRKLEKLQIGPANQSRSL